MSLFERLLATATTIESVEVDDDGGILAANPAFARRVGVPMESVLGRPLTDFVATHEIEKVRDWWRRPASLPEGPTPVSFVTACGDPYTLRCLVEPRTSGARIVGEIDAQGDRTAAQELMRLNNELSALSRENTRRRRELERAQKELAAAHEDLATSYWHLRKIQEVIPLCMRCGRVKTGAASWETLVDYLGQSEIFLSHGYCPVCAATLMEEMGLDGEDG